jgi:transposase InsO family protein
MSKAGYPYDNSAMESFFASLKKEFFYRREYATIDDVE